MGEKVAKVCVIALFALPLIVHAQVGGAENTNTDALHVEIKAQLLLDPRSKNLSDAELEALISGLIQEAKASGVASDYSAPQESFDYSALFTPQEVNSTSLSLLSPSFIIAFFFLLLTLIGVILYILRRKVHPEDQSDLADLEVS